MPTCRREIAACLIVIAAAEPAKRPAAEHKLNAREAEVHADLQRNLAEKSEGFIVRWSFDKARFTLVVDRSRYEENKFYVAAVDARAIFDSNGVPLPRMLIVKDVSGEELGRGPFANVPALME